MKSLNKVFCLPLYKFDFLGCMLQSLVLPVFLFACFSLNINKSCVQEVFSESPRNIDTQITWTLWPVSSRSPNYPGSSVFHNKCHLLCKKFGTYIVITFNKKTLRCDLTVLPPVHCKDEVEGANLKVYLGLYAGTHRLYRQCTFSSKSPFLSFSRH